jgi:sucrose-6-phosphate hydrolase SacC (GH32 family)
MKKIFLAFMICFDVFPLLAQEEIYPSSLYTNCSSDGDGFHIKISETDYPLQSCGLCAEQEKDRTDEEEPYRPHFHFTSATGTISDPNGLVYYQGKYHLFFQHNPDNDSIPVPQHWGHAVSTDLVHWKRLPIAIYPHHGGNIWSGSAVVDHQNSLGLQKKSNAPIVAFYTWEKNFTQRMAYSNDGARTFTEYADNPVVEFLSSYNRDPKVFWHDETSRWIMVLYVEGFDFFASNDLKNWRHLSTSRLDLHECPDFFELPVDGNKAQTKWVLLDASGTYYIGKFDGKRFTPVSGPHISEWNNRICYATQTWSNIPQADGRRIQIAGMRDDRQGKVPSENYQNQMTFPVNLTLKSTDEGIRMFRYPIREIEKLYGRKLHIENKSVQTNSKVVLGEGALLDIKTTVKIADAESFVFNLRGAEIEYDVAEQRLMFGDIAAPLKLHDGKLELRFLIDRSSLEVFGNKGRISISRYFLPERTKKIYIQSNQGEVEIKTLEIRHINSIWK